MSCVQDALERFGMCRVKGESLSSFVGAVFVLWLCDVDWEWKARDARSGGRELIVCSLPFVAVMLILELYGTTWTSLAFYSCVSFLLNCSPNTGYITKD